MSKEWTADEIYEARFDTIQTSGRGHTDFLSVSDEQAGGWGVDVVVLEDGAGYGQNMKFAYRWTNPMSDGDWELGGLDELTETLNDMELMWTEFIAEDE